MRVKNISGTTQIWVGQTLTDDQEYDIPVQDITNWQSNDKVIVDLAAETLLIGDSNTYKATPSEAIAFLMGG